MLLSMIRISKIETVKDMDNAIDKVGDAIAEMAGLDVYLKMKKGAQIGQKIESLRMKCVLQGWMDQVDRLQETMELCQEVSHELDSARQSLKQIARNTNR